MKWQLFIQKTTHKKHKPNEIQYLLVLPVAFITQIHDIIYQSSPSYKDTLNIQLIYTKACRFWLNTRTCLGEVEEYD